MNKRHYEHTLPNIRGSLSNTYGFGSPLNYKGPTANASGKAGFSGKIPERSEDDFFRNRLRPDLAVRQEAFANFAL